MTTDGQSELLSLSILAGVLGRSIDDLVKEVDAHSASPDVVERAYDDWIGGRGVTGRTTVDTARLIVIGELVRSLTVEQRAVYHAALLHMRAQGRVVASGSPAEERKRGWWDPVV